MSKLLKKFVLLLLSFMVALGAAACNAGGGDDNSGGKVDDEVDVTKNITLNIESAAPLKQNYLSLLRSEKEGTQLYNQALFTQKLVSGFKALYPNIKLQFIEDGWGDALYQQQQLYIRDYNMGGKMPVDILIGETYMNYFAKNGVFSALNQDKFSEVNAGACGDMMIGDKLYGVPMCTGIMGLQYNTTILAEANIPEDQWVPKNWEELKENCRKVNEYAVANGKTYRGIIMNNVSGMSGAFRALPFMKQAGGNFVDASGNLTLDTPANAEAFTYLRELATYAYADSLTQTSEDTLQYYFTNKGYAAYMVEGQWSMTSAPDNIKSAPLPTKGETGKGNVFMGNVLFGISKASSNQAAAQAFLQYLTSSEVQLWLYELDGRLPINNTTLKSAEIRTIHPAINAYIDALNEGGFSGGLWGFTKNSSDIWDKWGTFYSNVLRSNTSIETLLGAVQADIAAKM